MYGHRFPEDFVYLQMINYPFRNMRRNVNKISNSWRFHSWLLGLFQILAAPCRCHVFHYLQNCHLMPSYDCSLAGCTKYIEKPKLQSRNQKVSPCLRWVPLQGHCAWQVFVSTTAFACGARPLNNIMKYHQVHLLGSMVLKWVCIPESVCLRAKIIWLSSSMCLYWHSLSICLSHCLREISFSDFLRGTMAPLSSSLLSQGITFFRTSASLSRSSSLSF